MGGRIVGKRPTYPQNTPNIGKYTRFGPFYLRIWRGRPLLNFPLRGTRTLRPRATAQELCALFTAVLQKASSRFIPRGSRADPKPWTSDPQLDEAVADRRATQASIDPTDPSTIERWREARRRAAEVDSRVSRERFREMASTELNRHSSLGKVTRMLKKWECAADDDHRDGQAMRHDGRLVVNDKKAEAFCATSEVRSSDEK